MISFTGERAPDITSDVEKLLDTSHSDRNDYCAHVRSPSVSRFVFLGTTEDGRYLAVPRSTTIYVRTASNGIEEIAPKVFDVDSHGLILFDRGAFSSQKLSVLEQMLDDKETEKELKELLKVSSIFLDMLLRCREERGEEEMIRLIKEELKIKGVEQYSSDSILKEKWDVEGLIDVDGVDLPINRYSERTARWDRFSTIYTLINHLLGGSTGVPAMIVWRAIHELQSQRLRITEDCLAPDLIPIKFKEWVEAFSEDGFRTYQFGDSRDSLILNAI